MKTSCAILALLAAATAPGTTHVAEARSYGRLVSPHHDRRYQYSRRSPTVDPFGLLSDIFTMPVYMNSLFQQQQRDVTRLLAQAASPNYSVTQDEETGTMQLVMELPGVQAKDLTVEVVDGRVLRISGSRKFIRNGSIHEAEFDQSFDMQGVYPEQLKVTLSSGILTIQSPKKEKAVLRIPISTVDEVELKPDVLDGSSSMAEKSEADKNEAEHVQTEVDDLTIVEE